MRHIDVSSDEISSEHESIDSSSSSDSLNDDKNKRRKKKQKRRKLIREAIQILRDIKYDEKKQKKKFGSGNKEKKTLKGGATGVATRGISNNPPKKDNPLKRELNNPQGLDFASQAGCLMAQPSSIKLLPPIDMSKEATIPEQTTSGVKLETTRTLRTKTDITDVAMQGSQSFTFEYEASFHNPRFYKAVVKFMIKLISAPPPSGGYY